MLTEEVSRTLTLEYCRHEFKTLISCCALLVVTAAAEIATVSITPSNTYGLPFNYYIILLPLNGSFLNYVLNYIYQRLVSVCAASFFLPFLPITFIMMNHTCLEVDATIVHVSGENRLLKKSKGQKNSKVRTELEKHLKGLVEQTMNILEWQKNVQNMLRFNFILEFTELAFIFCVSLLSMTKNYSGLS